MADMFGAPVGMSIADNDMAKLMGTASNIMLQQSQIPVNRAHAELYKAQAEEKKQEAAVQARLAAEMANLTQGQAPTGEGNPIDRMASVVERVGMAHLNAGSTVKGSEILSKASTMRRQEEQNRGTQALAEHRRFDDAVKGTEWLLRGMDQVNSAEDGARLNALFEQTFNRPSPLRGVDFGDPATRERMKGMMLTQYQRLQLEQADRRIDAVEDEYTSRDVARRQAARDRQIAEARRERADQARRAREKEAGRTAAATAPSGTQLQMADDLLKAETKNMPAEDRKLLSAAIAAKANALVKKNRGLDWNTALNQALNEERKANHIPRENDTILGVENPLRERDYYRPTGSLAKPRALPQNNEYEEGVYYRGGNGEVRQWINGNWSRPVDAATLKRASELSKRK